MKRSTKAALLSGLLFPGVGQLYLGRRLRGAALMTVAVLALAVIVRVAIERARVIVDRILSGEIPVDAATIAAMVSSDAAGDASPIANIAVIALVACWMLGIIDALTAGSERHQATGQEQDRQQRPSDS